MQRPNDGRGQKDPREYAGPQLHPTRAIPLWHEGRQYAASVMQPHSQMIPDPYNNETSPFYPPPSTFMPPESPNVPGPVLPSQLRPSSMLMQTSRSSQDNEYGGVSLPNANIYDRDLGPSVASLANANDGRLALSDFAPFRSIQTTPRPHILDSPTTMAVTHGSSNAEAHSRFEAPTEPKHNNGIALDSSEASDNPHNSSINLERYGVGVDPFPMYKEDHPSRLQSNTFSNLTDEQGLRAWNNSFFDDRWIVGSDEPWLLPPRRSTSMTQSPGVYHTQLGIIPRPLSEISSTGATRHSEANIGSLVGSFPNTAHALGTRGQNFPRVRGTSGPDEYDTLAGYAKLAGTGNNTGGNGSGTQGGEVFHEVEPGLRVHPPGAIGDGRKKPSEAIGNGRNDSTSSGTVRDGRSGQNQATAYRDNGESSSTAGEHMKHAQYIASIFPPVNPHEQDKTDINVDGVRIRQADLSRYFEQQREEHQRKDTQPDQEEVKMSGRGRNLTPGQQYRQNMSNLRGILQSVSEVPENTEPSAADTLQDQTFATIGSSGNSGEPRTEMQERDMQYLAERTNQDTSAGQSVYAAEDAAATSQQVEFIDNTMAELEDLGARIQLLSRRRSGLSGASQAFTPRGILNRPATSQSQAQPSNTVAELLQPDTYVPNTDNGLNVAPNPQQLYHYVRGADGQLHLMPYIEQNPQQSYAQNLTQNMLQYGQQSVYDPYAARYPASGQQSPAFLTGVQHQQLVANRHGGYTPLIPPGFEGLVGRYTDPRRFGGIGTFAPYHLPAYTPPAIQQPSIPTTPVIRAPVPSHTTRSAVLGPFGTRPVSRASSQQSLASPALAGPMVTNAEWSNRFGGMARQPSAAPALPLLPYRPGSDAMFPHPPAGSSVRLQTLTRDGQPTDEQALRPENMPFAEVARDTQPAEWGVARIGNIPYSLTKAEVHAFLGRNAKVLTPNLGEPIHIIMERSTGKTMDCYVEFFSVGDAQAAINKLHRQRDEGNRYLRLQDRHVEVEISSQEALMKELFPRAKNVQWRGQVPMIIKTDEPYNSGFKAFVTAEELVMLVKHAEQPQRSPYTQKNLQRTYECLISTVLKFPWHATTFYTLLTRNQLYTATYDMLTQLIAILKHGGAPGLSEVLLSELLSAGLNAAGFSERQKWVLKGLVDEAICGPLSALGAGMPAVRMSPVMRWWPWETLGRKAGVEEDVVLFYAHILSLSNNPSPITTALEHSSYHTRNLTLTSHPALTHNPFGTIAVHWPDDVTGGMTTFPGATLTMDVAARIEWGVLKECIRRVLGGGDRSLRGAEEQSGGPSDADSDEAWGRV